MTKEAELLLREELRIAPGEKLEVFGGITPDQALRAIERALESPTRPRVRHVKAPPPDFADLRDDAPSLPSWRDAMEAAAKVARDWNRHPTTGEPHETSANIAEAILNLPPPPGAPVETGEAARQALEPFARFADALNEAMPDEIALGFFCGGGMNFGPSGGACIGDLRRARAALSAMPAAERGGGGE